MVMENVFMERKVSGEVNPASLFPDQLPREPDLSRIYIDSFEGEGNSVYKAAHRQNSCFAKKTAPVWLQKNEKWHFPSSKKAVNQCNSITSSF